MVLKTLREIKPYEEITYDYNFDSFNMEAQVSEHRCYRKKRQGGSFLTGTCESAFTLLCCNSEYQILKDNNYKSVWNDLGFLVIIYVGLCCKCVCVCAKALALFHIFKPGVLFAVQNYKIASLFNSTKPASQ